MIGGISLILFLNNLDIKDFDEEQFNEFYETYYRYVYKICINILGNDYELLKDVVQDVFFKAALTMHVMQDAVSAKAWLATLARNEALNAAKKKSIEKRHVVDLDDEIAYATVPASDLNSSPLRIIVDQEAVNAIFEEMLAMDKKYADILLLKMKFHLDIADIAKLLNIKLATAYARYERGREKLKARIAARVEV